MRPQTACVACRKRRRKCEWISPNESCTYCKKRKALCSFVGKSQDAPETITQSPRIVSNVIEAAQVGSFTSLMPPEHVCLEVVRHYFQYIHDIQLSLFHQPTFLADLAVNAVPMVILMAILGLAARFSNDPFFDGIEPRSRGRFYATEAAKLLDLSDVSTTTIRACLLMGACYGSEGKAAAENVHYTIACRMGLLLNIPNIKALDPLEQELNNRLWWALIMSDVWTANGVQLPRLLTLNEDVPYPMEETQFLELRHETTDHVPTSINLVENLSGSMFAQMIKLNSILIEISDMNQAAVNQPSSFTFDRTVEGLEKKLNTWYRNLPSCLQDNQENMSYHAAKGQGGTFVAIYLGYYHYGQLLFYQYLHQNIHGDDDIPTRTGYYADKCKAYSTGLCDIVYRAMRTPGAEVLYSMVGHVLVIASTVQLHTLLFDADDAQIRNARRRLERNFQLISRLQTFWPFDNSFDRFQEFHKACQRSKESSFRMDKWMLRFLFENAKPIQEKPDEEDSVQHYQLWSTEEFGFSPFDALT